MSHSTDSKQRGLWLVVVLLVAAPLVGSCDRLQDVLERRCKKTEKSYDRALERETTELKPSGEFGKPDDRAPHFGLTLSNQLLTDLSNIAVEPALKAALEIVSAIRVNGVSVDLNTKGDIVDLKLSADDTCDHCFRVRASLGGGLVAGIPSVGRQEAKLDGVVQFVAPLLLEEGDEKSAAVKLDLEKFSEYGVEQVAARISDPRNAIPDNWERQLEGPLAELLTRRLDRRLKDAVTLIEFNGPSFGLDGFELTPVALKSDDEHGAVFAGFSANIAALNEETIEGVEPVTDLADGQNIALSFQPELIFHALSLLMGDEEKTGPVSRIYNRAGRASESGAYRVTLETFGVGAEAAPGIGDAGLFADGGGDASMPISDATAGGLPDAGDVGDIGVGRSGAPKGFGLGFKVYRYESGGVCFSAGARAIGGAAVRQGDLRVGIRDVEFTGDGVPQKVLDIANWTSAQFIRKTRGLIRASVEGKNITVPGTSLSVGPLAIGLRPNTVVLRGNSRMK